MEIFPPKVVEMTVTFCFLDTLFFIDHALRVFETAALDSFSVLSEMETTAADGKNYETSFYRLEAILTVDYRVNSV